MMSVGDLIELLGEGWMKRFASDTPQGISTIPESRCLDCGGRLNAVRAVDGEPLRPIPGDLTICTRCGAVMTFGKDLRLRGLTEEEELHLLENRGLMQQLKASTRTVHFLRHKTN